MVWGIAGLRGWSLIILTSVFMTARMVFPAAAQNPVEIDDPAWHENVRLRQAVAVILDEKERENDSQTSPIEPLERAILSAREVKDHYHRSNALRYTARLCRRAGDHKKSRLLFAEALDAAMQIRQVARQLSGVIGVIESQGRSGDHEGARMTTLTAVERGLLDRIDGTGKPGETNRLLTNLDGMLRPVDVLHLVREAEKLETALIRLRIYYKLFTLTWHEDNPPFVASAPEYKPGRTEKEQFIHALLMTRLAAKSAQPQEARVWLTAAKEALEALPTVTSRDRERYLQTEEWVEEVLKSGAELSIIPAH